MARCEECIHFEICEIMHDQWGVPKIHPSQCGFFVVSADVAPKTETAREIFEEIDLNLEDYMLGDINGKAMVARLSQLKKKYTEGEK